MRRRQKNEGRYTRAVGNTIDMRDYGKVAMNQLWPGRVVFAHVPFRENPNNSKPRPVVVGEVRGRDIYAFPIYSAHAPWRLEIYRHARRCYVDTRPVVLDKINLISTDPEDIEGEILVKLLERLDRDDQG
jgi:hypothetical protein